MQYLSLFSGIEAASVAWHPLGWRAVAFAETEPFPWRGKTADQCPDSPRYRALGNSMAVPVMRWIGQQIDAATNFENMEKAA